ncbi:hypothetical protein EJD97_002194, partial [Solanum chilense]
AQSAVDQQAARSGSPEPTSSAIWTPSVVSSATTAPSVVPPSISTVRELDAPAAPAANSDALIWYASSSASEALIASPSLSAPSSVLAPRPLLNPYASLNSLEGDVVESLQWKIGPPTVCLQQARQKGPQTPAP